MSPLHTINPSATCASTGLMLLVNVNSATWGELPPGITRHVPPAISLGQAYYWTHAWQLQEAESRAALAAGDFVEFDGEDANDVVRWLFGDDVE